MTVRFGAVFDFLHHIRVLSKKRACHPKSPLFPYTTLFRSVMARLDAPPLPASVGGLEKPPAPADPMPAPTFADRKSTRLNSSHANISYAVFCLKKKKKTIRTGAGLTDGLATIVASINHHCR